jgi:hypothetical protein
MTITENLLSILGFGKKHSKKANIEKTMRTSLMSITAGEHPKAHRALMGGFAGHWHASSNVALRRKIAESNGRELDLSGARAYQKI